jgi:hypothetical protein
MLADTERGREGMGALMSLSRRVTIGISLTGASLLMSGSLFATEALAKPARKRTSSKKPAAKASN